MKRSILLLLVLFPMMSFGQVTIQNNLLATAGETQTDGVFVLDYSFGEVFTATLNDGANYTTQGFQQPKGRRRYTETIEDDVLASLIDEEFGTFKVYPNPTFDYLFVETNVDKKMTIDMIDMTGRKVTTFELFGMKNQIDLRPYENGTYHLLIQVDQEKVTRLPIVKAN